MQKPSLATLGGGCFWCTEAIYSLTKGVISVQSGYSGGSVVLSTYEDVCSGNTGHAEVVQILYDEELISYKEIIQIHLSTHDPTQLNKQGADTGTQYRSIIFTHDNRQKKIAEEVIKEMQLLYNQTIVTEIEPLEMFYQAELAHQQYYERNALHPYCTSTISPKIAKFKKEFASKLKVF